MSSVLDILRLAIYAISTIFIKNCSALSHHNRQRELSANEPPPLTHYTVPLQGALTCYTLNDCTNLLPLPESGAMLQYITLARGSVTYSCKAEDQGQPPTFISQLTRLYNAIPLLEKIGDETKFHNIVPQFLNYDYTTLKNSSLTCIGTIETVQHVNVVDIFDVAAFPVFNQRLLIPPEDPQYNLDWAMSQSQDKKWTVYRVKTFGGASEDSCYMQTGDVTVDYAAEYWIYHE